MNTTHKPVIRFYASRDPFMFGREIVLRCASFKGDDLHAIAHPVIFEVPKPEYAEQGTVEAPFLALTNDEAQSLVDALWTAGMRPSEGTGSAGQLAAVKEHLDDMRAIVATQLAVQLKR